MINTLKTALTNDVNSAAIWAANHCYDNSFLEPTVREFARALKDLGYEPVGICWNIPFQSMVCGDCVAFCFRRNGELVWCHMSRSHYKSLLCDIYGRENGRRRYESMRVEY